jgi:hypothetical protein
MSKYNVSTPHPLIPNSQEYMFEKKYISIQSEDRNVLKYPNAGEFEIELPQDYCNVQSISLSTWSFPGYLNTFSKLFNNIVMTFIINEPYLPDESHENYESDYNIYEALYNKQISNDPYYIVTIEEGNYTYGQLQNELTNQFNKSVSNYIIKYFIHNNNQDKLDIFIKNDKYKDFTIVYNEVTQKLLFGNNCSGFILTNDSPINIASNNHITCDQLTGIQLPSINDYGLPYNLGLLKTSIESTKTVDLNDVKLSYTPNNNAWITPKYLNCNTYHINAPLRINMYGTNTNYYIFMELSGYNSIDETIPYSDTKFTRQTNITNGVVNSSFAKIPVYTNQNNPPECIYYNELSIDNTPKIFNPPAVKIRKLKIKMRYHNGIIVNFNGLSYSITLQLGIFLPQNARKTNMYVPESIANL